MIQRFLNSLKNNKKSKLILLLLLFIVLLSLGYSCYAYYFTVGSFSGTANISIPPFDPRVNSSSEETQTINLVETITNNKNLAPGAIGKFKIDIDLSNVGYDSFYKLMYDRTGIPNNLKFYVDEDLTTELSILEGVINKDDSIQTAEHYIYWKWIVDNSLASNTNDSLCMEQDISVEFTSYISQIVEKNTVIVNDIEKSTGRINLINTHTGNNKGSFNISLDLSNIEADTQYRIYFNEKELSSNLHLYSDSTYQTEINYIQGTYDGINSEVTNTIYWELETDNINTLSSGLYYVVVFGSW